MRRMMPFVVALLALLLLPLLGCALFEQGVVPEDAWNPARPTLVALLERVESYRTTAGLATAPIVYLRQELKTHDGAVPGEKLYSWEKALRPLLDEHDGYVRKDASLSVMRSKVWLREGEEARAWLDSALRRVGMTPGGGS